MEKEQRIVKEQIKKYALKGEMKNVQTLAKPLVQSNKSIARLYAAKATLNSTIMQIKEQEANLKVFGAMKQSAMLMARMNELINVKQVSHVALAMSKEMMKMGVIQECIEDVFEEIDDDELEEEAQAEIDKVLYEVTNGKFGSIGVVPTSDDVDHKENLDASDQEEDVQMEDLQARLAHIRAA